MILWGFYHGSGRGSSKRKSAATTTASIGAGLPVLMAVMYGGVPNVIRSSSKHAGGGNVNQDFYEFIVPVIVSFVTTLVLHVLLPL